jgi:hypothetical protein
MSISSIMLFVLFILSLISMNNSLWNRIVPCQLSSNACQTTTDCCSNRLCSIVQGTIIYLSMLSSWIILNDKYLSSYAQIKVFVHRQNTCLHVPSTVFFWHRIKLLEINGMYMECTSHRFHSCVSTKINVPSLIIIEIN